MKQYEIKLILSEDNVQVLTDSLKGYKGSKKLIADTISFLIKRQLEIQKKKQTEELCEKK